ncbi:Type I secretion adaptor protein (HlyD family) [Granulibacter bethesdensis]|uniref:HlyD family type I secretion periplasmic adaptor subunit n=1 Tax=Granulibacter bethesdensis TaxID=364410 RepID=UPI00090C6B02|nr:HlyD family type I secretion periplasmic adaptor subunit [Granulibacter bethesdensis]APH55976.1 Type I secretion adaptor protein (HlyD family) [Granulibacter bethesdensis]
MASKQLKLAQAKDTAELLEFESPSSAVIATPVLPTARHNTLIVFGLVTSLLLAAGLVPVDKVVTARGKVISRVPIQVVQPLDTAIVRSINVTEGQVVHKGELLAQLDPTFASADMGQLRDQVRSLEAELARLHAEADGKPYIAQADNPDSRLQAAIYAQRQAEWKFKVENYNQKISGLQNTVAKSLAEANYYRQRLAIATNVESMRHELERLQVGSKLNSLAAVDNRLEMSRDLATATSTAETARRDMQALVAERDGFIKEWAAKIGQDIQDEGRKYSEQSENLKKAQLRHKLVELQASGDAVIQSIAKVSVGSVLQSGAQFITIVPLDAPLEVEADVPGEDAGFVHVGDTVTVKFDTFPFTQYGGAQGIVRVTSPDSYSQNDSRDGQLKDTQQSSMAAEKTFYKARVTIDKVTLHDTPEGFHIVPGMPVTADIKVGQRTILKYLLGKVLPAFSEGMREP